MPLIPRAIRRLLDAKGERFMAALVFGLLAFSPSAYAVTNQISSVSPSSAAQGTKGLLVSFTLNATPPPPATNIAVSSVTIGNIVGTVSPRTDQYIVSALFDIPGNEPPGNKDLTITFPGSFTGYKAAGFTVTAATEPAADFAATPTSGTPPLTVNFTDASAGPVTSWLWDFGDDSTSTETNPVHTYNSVGSFPVSLTVLGPSGSNTLIRSGFVTAKRAPANGAYVIVDTGQTNCYNNTGVIDSPAAGQPFYGQDAQFSGSQPAYKDNGDGTVTDLNTGLMWVQARGEQSSWADAMANAANCRVGDYSDWRAPTIKELYSLVKSTGANGASLTSSAGFIPYIDTDYFGFAYGGNSTTVGSRIIDAQDWSANYYVSTVMGGQAAAFGYNFTDGRIKGYPPAKENYIRYVRGNPDYGINKFVNNGDGTISDVATRLIWARNDSGIGLNWSDALAWVQTQNAANYLGHNDWRLPNAKELQSIVDYTHSPDTTGSPALDPMFNCTQITNEAGQADYPFFWAGTTLITGPNSAEGLYFCFGRAMGYMNGAWVDAHGAGAQRSDVKSGNPADYPTGHGPQGDAVRIFNYIRLVRDIPDSTAWRFAFVGDTHVPLSGIASEIAAAVLNDNVKLVIVDGDLVESGPGTPSNTFRNQLLAWRDAFAPVYANGVGVYVVRGNHENDVPDNLAVWNSVFSGDYAMPDNGPAGEENLTYSFTHDNAFFVGLDDYTNIHRINQPWLDEQLAANRQPHIFTFGHEPAFKAFHTDCLDDYPTERNAFWSSLATAGARVYLCGHDHFFNVARIDDGDGNFENDLYQFIVGSGGTTNWPPQNYNYNGTNAPFTPVNLASVTDTYGYLLVEISGPGPNDLDVTVTWKQRTYDANTASYLYVPTPNVFTYTAVNRFAETAGRLMNLSIRSSAGTGAETLIVGFVTEGGTENASLLVRAAGPALLSYGVSGVLADPSLTVNNAVPAVIESSDDWAPSLNTTFGQLGAFPWTEGSKDAALALDIPRGAYTVVVTGADGERGIALAEIYDVSTAFAATRPKLVNVSARTEVGTGENIMIAGFVIEGAAPQKVLVRAIGPTLTDKGVTGVLADPQLAVFKSSIQTGSNDDWDSSLSATFTQVGAFALNPASKDAALLMTLDPGVYTVQVSGGGGTTGVALVEIYAVP